MYSSSLCNLGTEETIHRILWEAVVRVVAVYTSVPVDCILVPHYNLYKGHLQKLKICMFSWHHFSYLVISIFRRCSPLSLNLSSGRNPLNKVLQIGEPIRHPNGVRCCCRKKRKESVVGQVGPELRMKHQWIRTQAKNKGHNAGEQIL